MSGPSRQSADRSGLSRITRHVPVLAWLGTYRRADLPGDLIAGTVVAIMLVPQGMAYALLAGMPPEVGLYASIAPPLIYALFGSSRTLAVGPVAIASLMTATAIAGLGGAAAALPGPVLALLLAAMSGTILLAMGLFRLGFLTNFLSHPVISGFTSAAAIIIIVSQLKQLLGLDVPKSHGFVDGLLGTAAHLDSVNATTAAIGVGAILILLFARRRLVSLLAGLGLPHAVAAAIGKGGPIIAALAGLGAVVAFDLDRNAGVRVVGAIPAGLPDFTMPALDPVLIRELLPAALLIALIGFLESVSVARALAAKRRQKIDPDQELLGLGMANLGAAFSGGYPVAGGFGRSVVNFSAGANTPLASIVTAVLVALVVGFFTPVLHRLPIAVLAAIIVVAVASLIDVRSLLRAWRYNRADAAGLAVTFAAVLAAGIEIGIAAGIALSLALYLWRTSRPHMAVVGRLGDSEHFRNVLRHPVRLYPGVQFVRVDESLYFANTAYLEDRLLAAAVEDPEIEHLVLICSAVNFIDGSALESLEQLVHQLREMGVTLHLAEVKGPVMDRLERGRFVADMAPGRIFLSTHDAAVALAGGERRPDARGLTGK
ncbi:SulP family inorganic anion transporter [Oceanibacterium hippocampi]|uniref:Putative sulfate transporter/MT1781 n=1 Tax=Oceanibacterium hippocampi TaxID=745714 RepID=A0A1Y5RWZ5_9PROT|nr:sulfate permease [Oceanibacterium hippocampi]SLN27519.1 putative sulfate transporter/MT1781 [Oceanibacterium hippocampi]